ncbi:MAG: ammonium transporter [Thermoplasmata archaeon]|nr:ammonium transporter [Thermoplasmata archaeon]MCI4359294.1 ammonium transporter [Thermoplasmata archaeon]
MIASFLVNNLWVLLAGLLVFTMTIAVGLLEVGELGEMFSFSLLKTTFMTGAAVVIMAAVGFNVAFAPTWNGLLGNPGYAAGFFLGGFSSGSANPVSDVWWSVQSQGLTLGTYFLFETAFAAVTLALVGVVFLRKVKLKAIGLYTILYFLIIWNLPAAWIWNPSGWLANLGMVDFAGGLVVHGAAGAAGMGVVVQIWREERARGAKTSPQVPIRIQPSWLTLAILLLWVGWFGFNPGSVLQFNDEAIVVVLTTFLAASAAFLSLLVSAYLVDGTRPDMLWGTNGILMGLIIITPLAGFVSPGSAILLGLLGGPLFLGAEKIFARFRWYSDPVGLFPGHLVGGVFGVAMIAFFSQTQFSTGSGAPGLPDGLLFGGGLSAIHQLGVEMFGVVVVLIVVFVLSFGSMVLIAKLLGGITVPPTEGASEPGPTPIAVSVSHPMAAGPPALVSIDGR